MSIPRNLIGVPRETSSLLPQVDSTAPPHLWKQLAQGNERASALTNALGVANNKLNGVRQNTQSALGMHPWKIYPLVEGVLTQAEEESIGITPENRWRCFRVRSGAAEYVSGTVWLQSGAGLGLTDFYDAYGNNGIGGGGASGTDKMRTFDTSEVCLNTDTISGGFTRHTQLDESPFTVHQAPEDLLYYVFTRINNPNGTGFEVYFTADPIAAGWTNFPRWNPYFIPLGWVDMRPSDNPAVEVAPYRIHQIAYGNLDYWPATAFYGTHNEPPEHLSFVSTFGYPMNAIVKKARGEDKTATYISLFWFNGADVDSSSAWAILGEYTN